MCGEGGVLQLVGMPTRWVNANDFFDRIGLSGAKFFSIYEI